MDCKEFRCGHMVGRAVKIIYGVKPGIRPAHDP